MKNQGRRVNSKNRNTAFEAGPDGQRCGCYGPGYRLLEASEFLLTGSPGHCNSKVVCNLLLPLVRAVVLHMAPAPTVPA